eukprot:403356940
MDKQSPEEKLAGVEIKPVERECLERVFEYLRTRTTNKPKDVEQKISAQDLIKTLQILGEKPTKSEVDLMIWEVDDDLDKQVSKIEFDKMYKRCISDESGLEPRKLYNLVVFLMYDKEFKGRVSVEDTLQLLYVRHGRPNLDEEIKAIFGENEKTEEGNEKFIEYHDYIEKINHRAMEERKKRKADKKLYYSKQLGVLKNGIEDEDYSRH